MFVKYFTTYPFRNCEFAEMLREKMCVRAYAVPDGVIIDRDTFNRYPIASMPQWALLNREDINSRLHTREALPDEEYHARTVFGYNITRFSECGWRVIGKADHYCDALVIARAYKAHPILTGDIAIVDNQTGEVMDEL